MNQKSPTTLTNMSYQVTVVAAGYLGSVQGAMGVCFFGSHIRFLCQNEGRGVVTFMLGAGGLYYISARTSWWVQISVAGKVLGNHMVVVDNR